MNTIKKIHLTASTTTAAIEPIPTKEHYPARSRFLERPLTPKEAADLLGLDDKTVLRWARMGYLPGHPLGQGKRKFWRFLESELREWLSAQNNVDIAA